MSSSLSAFFVHETRVERKTGSSPSGSVLAAAVPLKCFVDQTSKLVRTANGSEVVAAASVFYPADTPLIPLGSYVTLPARFGGQRAQVVDFAVRDSGSLGLPDHIEVNLA